MSKHDLQNKRLDQIGRSLLKATRASTEEIEKLVAAPQLFDSVKARIKADEQSRRKSKRFFDDWASVSFWNRQMAGALAVLIILVGCSALIIFKTQGVLQLTEQTIKPEIQAPIIEAEKTLSSGDKETKIPAVKNHRNVEQVAFKPKSSKLPNRLRKPNPVKATPSNKESSQEIFYSLVSAGNWGAEGEDLQRVRAELSRAELLALGVNLPVENEAAKIKTDLLVGTDGVARAIRFVEKF